MFSLKRIIAESCKLSLVINRNVMKYQYDRTYVTIYKESNLLRQSRRKVINTEALTLHFHTSRPNKAIPPILWLIVRPILKIGAIIFGRRIRKWWHNLPKNKKAQLIEMVKRRKYAILGSWGAFCGFSYGYYYLHLEEHPITKRKRFIIFTEEQITKLAMLQAAMMIELNKTNIVSPSRPEFKRVENVVNRLLLSNMDLKSVKDTSWSITVVADETTNACVFPDGHIFVFTGMLKQCINDDQLGIILGHEVAHAILGHASEQLSNSRIAELLLMIPLVLLWSVFPDITALIYQIFSNYVVEFLVELPYSRNIEREADVIGLQLAAKSCFDVREAVTFWQHMSEVDPLNKHSEFVSSHPSHESRKQSLEEYIPLALELRKFCKCADLK